jgi:actin-related protein
MVSMPKQPDFQSLTLVPSTIGQIVGRRNPLVGQMISGLGTQAVNEAAEEYQKAAQEAARKAQEQAMKEAQEAQKRAQEQAEEAARRQAEEAAKQAQEAARRQQEEARRQAQAAQQQAQQQAQAAQQKAAEEAQRAQQQGQEAQAEATDQATRQAQEEAQRAAQQAQQQAAQEAQRAQQQAAQQAQQATQKPQSLFGDSTPTVQNIKPPPAPSQPVINPQNAAPTSFWPQQAQAPDPTRRPPMQVEPGKLPDMQQATKLPEVGMSPADTNPLWTAIRNRGFTGPNSPIDPKQIAMDFAQGNDQLRIGPEVARMAWAKEKGIDWIKNPTVLSQAPNDYIESWMGMWKANQAGAPLATEVRRELQQLGIRQPQPAVQAPGVQIPQIANPANSAARPGSTPSAYPFAGLPIPQQIQSVTGTSRGLIDNILNRPPQWGPQQNAGRGTGEPPARGSIPSMNRPGAVPQQRQGAMPGLSVYSASSNGPEIQDESGNILVWDERGRLVPSGRKVGAAPQDAIFPMPEIGSPNNYIPPVEMPNIDQRRPDQQFPGQVPSGTMLSNEVPLGQQSGPLYKSGTTPTASDGEGMTPDSPSRLQAFSQLSPLAAASGDFFSRQQGGATSPDVNDQMVRNLAGAIVNGEQYAMPAAEALGRLAWYRESGGREGPPEAAPESYVRNWIGAFRAGEDVTLAAEVGQQIRQLGINPPQRVIASGSPIQQGAPASQVAPQARAMAARSGDLSALYPLQRPGLDPDWDALCGPIGAMGVLAALGIETDLPTAKGHAYAVGWRPNQGMAGPQSEAALLSRYGVQSHVVGGVDPMAVKESTDRGVPVLLSSPGGGGHLFVVQSVDDQGRMDLGNSAMALKASGGRRVYTLQEMRSQLGSFGQVNASIFIDGQSAQQPQQPTAPQPTMVSLPPQSAQPQAAPSEWIPIRSKSNKVDRWVSPSEFNPSLHERIDPGTPSLGPRPKGSPPAPPIGMSSRWSAPDDQRVAMSGNGPYQDSGASPWQMAASPKGDRWEIPEPGLTGQLSIVPGGPADPNRMQGAPSWASGADQEAGRSVSTGRARDVGARLWRNAYQMSGGDATFADVVGGIVNGEAGFAGVKDNRGATGLFQMDPAGGWQQLDRYLRENNINMSRDQAAQDVDIMSAFYVSRLHRAYERARAAGVTDPEELTVQTVIYQWDPVNERGAAHNAGIEGIPSLQRNYREGYHQFKEGVFRMVPKDRW